MDKDRIKGSAEQAKGKFKETAGKVTGDAKTEAEGKADQVKGKFKIQSGVCRGSKGHRPRKMSGRAPAAL